MSWIFDNNYVEWRNENSQLPLVVYHDSEETPAPLSADETASQRKGVKVFLEKGRQGNNLQLVRNCCTYILVPRPSELFLILFSFQKSYFSVMTSFHKFLWMAMFSHRPRSCLKVFINVRLFYHKNKFLPQRIVTWSIQNEITSFQTDSFPQRKKFPTATLVWVRHIRLCGIAIGLFYDYETGKRPEVEISKSALLSLNDNNLTNTEPIATK